MSTHLYELLRQRAAQSPDAVVIGGQQGLIWKTLNGRELLSLVDRLADELAALGVTAGDRVVYWVPNHWRTPVYYFATWKLGAVAVPFDREMNPEAGARIVASVAPRLTISGYGERPSWAGQTGLELTEWWEPGSRSQATREQTPWQRPPEQLAVVVFTSGTTGTPKGCMISHGNLCSQAEAMADRIPVDTSCRLAGIMPLSHQMEIATLVYAVSAGAETHYVPSRRGPDILRVMQEQRVTHMVVVPQLVTTLGHALQKQLEERLSSAVYRAAMHAAERLPMAARRRLFWPVHRRIGGHLQLLIVGGAQLPAESQRLWEQLGVRVIQGFGTTECSPVITMGNPDGSTPVGSTGLPILDVSIKLSQEGEVLVHGPNVMVGYWRDPERTAEVLHDGWYATGDLGRIDEHGNLSISGRARDLIALPSGMNVWPQDVEDVLRSHPSVKDAAVLPVPTGRGGATLHAYLLPAALSDRATNVSLIVAACNARLAPHQRVATASWWEGTDFPRTALLKVKRHLLPLPATNRVATIDAILPSDDPVGQALVGLAHAGAIHPEQQLAELGIDSLGLVELAVTLEEKTGKALDEDRLRTEMTVAEVRAALDKAPMLAQTGSEGGRFQRRGISVEPPIWPYTWGRPFRVLAAPIHWLLRYAGQPITILGAEHLADLPERVMLAGTHRSFADMPLVHHALLKTGHRQMLRRMVTANMVGPEFTGIFAWLGVLALGLYPLDQQRGRDASLRRAVRTVQASGGSLLIFPQGTHATTAAELANDPSVRFRAGAAHLAAALNLTVVPFGLAGTENVIPPSVVGFDGVTIAGLPVSIKRRPLAIAFGEPLTLAAGESPQAFTERLQIACYALTREAEWAIQGGAASRPGVPSARAS